MSCETNFIKPNQFQVILDKENVPLTTFYCVNINLPSVTSNIAPTQFRGQKLPVDPDSIEYEPLNLRIMLDEKLDVYKEVFNWIRDNRTDDKYQGRDLILSTLSSHNNSTNLIRFKDVIPTSISSVPFDAQAQTPEYLSIDVTFEYTEFNFLNND